MANEYKIPYLETSAKTGQNVDESFVSLIKQIYNDAVKRGVTAAQTPAALPVATAEQQPASKPFKLAEKDADAKQQKKSCCKGN
jgi:hypothetical protein